MFVTEFMIIVGDVLVHPTEDKYTVTLPNVGSKNAAVKRINTLVLPKGTVKCNIYSVIDIQNRATYELEHVLVPIVEKEKWKWE